MKTLSRTQTDVVIHLIRHGKTAANAQNLYCGQTDVPLSDDGVAAITALKAQGLYPEAQLVFTSGFRRAEQTAHIICGTAGTAVAAMGEYHFGDFEMKSHEELKEQEAYRRWIDDETGDVVCPGGENKKQFARRVWDGFCAIAAEVRDKGAASALVVCHGGAIACVMDRLESGKQHFYDWIPTQGHGYTLVAEGDGFRLHGAVPVEKMG